MNQIYSCFKIAKGQKMLSFGRKSSCHINFVEFYNENVGKNAANSATLLKQMHDSCILEINAHEQYSDPIKELRLTNQGVVTWDDYWVDRNNKQIIDPRIETLNLQKNSLLYANLNIPRLHLKNLNLEGNLPLHSVFVYEAQQLEVLNISNCPSLRTVNLGMNKGIKALLVKNCNLSELTQESLLKNFVPTKTASSNQSGGLALSFRKKHETILDLRGSEIVWSNRNIASKIRLLLSNNWLVLWDNTPPASIIPPHFYSFFTANLEKELIKSYYSP